MVEKTSVILANTMQIGLEVKNNGIILDRSSCCDYSELECRPGEIFNISIQGGEPQKTFLSDNTTDCFKSRSLIKDKNP